ncbi:hypothetical protein [Beijerinckia sp. L45]|uniref:hypothetical protein n=1 Tax=Beijerinckia sp. L45 TaxID=1641855 RepID=UPI00131BC1E9|nr:hypothetical protein [Beijerinckia sp. L45]
MMHPKQPRPLAETAMDDVRAYPGIIGVAQDVDDRLVFLLDRDEAKSRDAVMLWAKAHALDVTIKIVGTIVTQ